MPNGGLKFACLLHFSGVLQKLFTHFTEVKHISVLCIGQKPPVASVRWDLIERSGGFFCLICTFGKGGALSAWESYPGACVAVKQNCLWSSYHFSHWDPPASPTALFPPALRLPWGFC